MRSLSPNTQQMRCYRERLPNRRPAATVTAEWNGRPLAVTVGFANDGRVLEVFARDARRVDTEIDRMLDDAAVLISRGLQHGDTLDSIAAGIGRLPDGAPSSIVGVVIDAGVKLAQADDTEIDE